MKNSNIELLRQYNTDKRVQEQLADTYLFSSVNPGSANKDNNVGTSKKKRKTRGYIVTLFIAALVLLAPIIYILSSYNFNLNITISKKIRPETGNLLTGGNITLLTNAARKGNLLTLTAENSNTAEAAIDLEKPLDMRNTYIIVNAVSVADNARFKIILRDKNHRSCSPVTLGIKNSGDKWQNYVISTDIVKDSVDIQHVRQIRFRVNGSAAGAKILIRKVSLITS